MNVWKRSAPAERSCHMMSDPLLQGGWLASAGACCLHAAWQQIQVCACDRSVVFKRFQ